jgi:hypothetical protein
MEARVCDLRPFFTHPDAPDRVAKFLKLLRAKFAYSTFRADVERELFVYARNAGDSTSVDRIRHWCQGYVAGL